MLTTTSELIEKLVEAGIPKGDASAIIRQTNPTREDVEQALDAYLEYKQTTNITNPAGTFRTALTQGWTPRPKAEPSREDYLAAMGNGG